MAAASLVIGSTTSMWSTTHQEEIFHSTLSEDLASQPLISRIPNELLLELPGYFCIEDVKALALVSHKFRAIVQETIYRFV